MLDDLKAMHDRDAQDGLGAVGKQWQQLQYEFSVPMLQTETIENIVYAGMGGSAWAALLASTWGQLTRPFEIIRGYDIPAYVAKNTLFIAASSSGNTEETVSALQKAIARGAQVVVIAGGGKLADMSAAKQYPYIALPKTQQPRYASLSNFTALIRLLEQAGLLAETSITMQLNTAATFIQDSLGSWLPEIPTSRNPAKQLAQELMGRSVVIYAGPKLYPAAAKWKINVNEDAKQLAWAGQYPEFNHNEFTGWSGQPVDKPYAIIELRSHLEHPQVQKRFTLSERLLSGKWPQPNIVTVEGQTLLTQLLWASAFADFVAIYLALLNGVNPTPLLMVDKFKQELEKA